MHLQCIACGKKYNENKIIYYCKQCGDLLEVKYNYETLKEKLKKSNWRSLPLSVWRYTPLMPIHDPSKTITLNEGGTGLHQCKRLGKLLKIKHLYVKNEGENPTGSFKDRGMTVGVTKAIELNMKIVICASTGNTAASLAAYAAKAALQCIVLIPSGKIAYGKLAQAMIYGAKVVQVKGNFDQALKIVLELSEKHKKIYLLNSINPFRIEGQKSLAYEICDQLKGKAPDKVIVPVGNAGNISAIWKGLSDFHQLNLTSNLPQMIGIQAEGAAPIAQAVKEGSNSVIPIGQPETVATAIRIGAPLSWKKAMRAIKESKGTAETVTDQEILEAQRILARHEGLFVEPASASSIAGLKKLAELGRVDADDTTVCVVTGHGLKDPDIIMQTCEKPVEIEAEIEPILEYLGLSKPLAPIAAQ
ncbi:MAG: threonine synthase [Candidatus Bathyarchaeota archaeon]|nr:MAG: threonine synthase [Candidatus Bathyarchaeota archaeon]